MRLFRIFCSLVAALLAATSPVAADQPAPCDQRCVLVKTITIRETTVTAKVALTGAIAPRYQSNIAFRTGGRIALRNVDVGDHVSADTVLATLDPRDQQSNVDNARATLASAQALLGQAQIAFARQQDLMKSGYTTRPSYDSAQQQLRTQTAAVESAKAALGTAQEQLGYTDLKPGVAGIIVSRDGEQGQVVQAGQSVFALAQDGPRDAVFDVYEALLAQPPEDKRVTITLLADPAVATIGTVREISPTVDDQAGSVRVKIGLDSVPKGMSLGATVVGTGSFRPRKAMLVPRAALFRWDDRPALWIYDPSTRKVDARVISISRYDGDDLVVTGGIAPGAHVVTAGIQFLYPGETVGVANAEVR